MSSKHHRPLRRLLVVVACIAACGCGDSELGPPSLLVRAAHAQAEAPISQQPAMPQAPVPAPATAIDAPSTGSAALHSYRSDLDPSHAAIASYGD
jgi:hypothetical protein